MTFGSGIGFKANCIRGRYGGLEEGRREMCAEEGVRKEEDGLGRWCYI